MTNGILNPSDCELVQMAAKAAGINLHVWGAKGSENLADMDAKPHGRLWNPLTDDGDALRLAAKLRIDLRHFTGATVCISASHQSLDDDFHECYGDDPCAALRRAIVRAAAAIGALHGIKAAP